MEKDDEPPGPQSNSELVKKVNHIDKTGILLRPNPAKGILGLCNASILNGNMVYRARVIHNRHETSVCMYQEIKNGDPRRPIGESREILTPEREYEKDGCEDARISKVNDTYFITYTAYEKGPRGGVRIALATTEDFKKISKYGIVGPQIRIREAAELLKNTRYEEHCNNMIKKLQHNEDPYLMDKDATIIYQNNEFQRIHRIGQDIWLSKAETLKELTDHEFNREVIKHPKKHVILKAPEGIMKYGLGDTPRWIDGRLIASGHQVIGTEGPFLNYYKYETFLMEFNEEGKIISKMKSPIPFPGQIIHFREYIGKGANKTLECMKEVTFGGGFAIDPENTNSLILTFGIADQMLGYRTLEKTHYLNELSHHLNRIAA